MGKTDDKCKDEDVNKNEAKKVMEVTIRLKVT